MAADTERKSPRVPSAWPAVVALCLVVTIALAMFACTIAWMHRTTEGTSHLVQNELRTSELLSNLRSQVMRLEADDPRPGEIERQVSADLSSYVPLLVSPEEAAEVARLRKLLAAVFAVQANDPARRVHFQRVQWSLDRLVEFNAHSAARTVTDIEDASRTILIVQIVAAFVLLAAASVVGSLLYRVLRRQRARIEMELSTLEERNSDLSAFVGRTAHDLRGPLTPIRGYADLLTAGSADVSKAAARIRASAQHMADILDDLTMLSTSGTLPVGEAEAGPVIREVLSELANELDSAQTHVLIEECRIACAPSVLRQIVHNVLANACKYRSPDRPLVIDVVSRCHGDHAEITISDNGIGMSPESVARAFEPYYRAPSASGVRGFGLGLSIVKRMVEVVHGSCELTSELGRGTRFHLRLPLVPAAT